MPQLKAPPREAKLLDINRLYVPTHYAKFLGVSRVRVYQMISNGSIPKERILDINGTKMIYHAVSNL